jgi:hypothetical protein
MMVLGENASELGVEPKARGSRGSGFESLRPDQFSLNGISQETRKLLAPALESNLDHLLISRRHAK